METTIDRAGRLVVPKTLRDQIGLMPGPVDIYVEGTRIVLEPTVEGGFRSDGSLMVIPASGEPLTDTMVRDLIDEGRP